MKVDVELLSFNIKLKNEDEHSRYPFLYGNPIHLFHNWEHKQHKYQRLLALSVYMYSQSYQYTKYALTALLK